MQITIIQDDGVVGVDGVFRKVDLSKLDPAIHAIQFDTVKGVGEIEYDPDATIEVDVLAPTEEDPDARAKKQVSRASEAISDFSPYQQFVDAWTAAAPKPPRTVWRIATAQELQVPDDGADLVAEGLTNQQPPESFPKWTGSAWMVDMDAARSFYASQIDAARTAAIGAGAPYGVHTYDADTVSQGLLGNAVNLVGSGIVTLPPGFSWRTADNIDVQLTLDDLKGIAASVFAVVEGAYQKAFALKDKVAAAQTLDDLKAIAW